MRAPHLLAFLLLAGCAAPAATPPQAAAPDPDALQVVAFRVEANETRIDHAGEFRPSLCRLEGCAVASPLGRLGWEPWQASLEDRGLFWRINATFAWVGEGIPARMAAYRMTSHACSATNMSDAPCVGGEPIAVAEGMPPLRLVKEVHDDGLEGITVTVTPTTAESGPLEGMQGRWSGAIQAFHRAPGAEDVTLPS